MTLIKFSLQVSSFAVLPNGNLVSGSVDQTIKIWNSTTCELIQTLTGHSGYVEALLFFKMVI